MSTHALPKGRVGLGSVFRLAWPVMIGMLSYNLMNLADTLFVGWLGTVELAAVGLAVTLSFFVLTPARGMIVGIKVTTSQRTGAQEHDVARSVLWQGVWLSLVLSLFVLALVPAGSQLFWLLGASPEVGAEANAYFLPRVLGAPLLCLLWALEAWFQGRGDMRTPMVATLVLNGINIALDPLLIFGLGPFPELGTAGAAWATNIAATASLAFLLFRARHVLWSRMWMPSMQLIREISKIGLPLSVQWTLDFSGFLVFMALLAQAGDAELAAHVLVFRVVQVSMLPGLSLADATGVLVGQAFGARRPEAARQAWWSGLVLAATAMTALGMSFVLIPQWLLSPFQPAPEVAALGVTLLAIGALFQLADSLTMVNLHTLIGAGDTRFTMWVSVGCSWFVQVPISLVLVVLLGWGAMGAWLGLTAEIFVVAAITLVRVRSSRWLEVKLDRTKPVEGIPLDALPAK